MKKQWKDFDNKLYIYLERRNKYCEHDIKYMQMIEQRNIDNWLLERKRIKKVFNLLYINYGLEVNFLKSIFFQSQIFSI